MNWICPICNGLAASVTQCPACGQLLDDEGRISDFTGDYSPYRPIEDLKLSNGYYDARDHLCLHFQVCNHCKKRFIVPFHEKSETELMSGACAH